MVNLRKFAIIVAGGSGSRMNVSIPKQFLLLQGKPLLMYSIEAFNQACPGISLLVVLPSGQFSTWKHLCDQHAFVLPHQLVEGGETRFHSVKNALACIGDEGLVAIHDGARPLISESLIRTVFLAAGQLGNCIPVIPLNESLRILSGETNRLVNRYNYRIVQTPQVFQAAIIKKAYSQEYRESFTDDAAVVETLGETIHLADGDPVNLKITHPYDLAAAEILINDQ
jgi:2-C-methyl-D-erythritol 4-phosphate cytidylyltransferase